MLRFVTRMCEIHVRAPGQNRLLVRDALPDARVVVMPGQQHTAMNMAPELFLREVVGFLLEPSAPVV